MSPGLPTMPLRRSQLPWIIASILCLAIAGVTWWKRPAQEAPTQVMGPVAVVDDAPTSRATPVARASGASMEAMTVRGEAARKELQARVDRTRETFAARFNAEQVDSAWSNAMERDLVALSDSDQIRAMNANVSNLEADCRSSICRIRAEVPSITAGDDWFTLYMTNVGAKLPEVAYRYVPGDDGKLRIELYAIGRR
jgi:hypothetical protein